MGRIFVTGDVHRDDIYDRLNSHFYNNVLWEGGQDENFVIVCGDFGVIWNWRGPDDTEKYDLKWLEKKPFTTLFVDGNHENHARLNEFPVEEWNGGKIHRISPHVIHLMRGQVFTICGKKFFTMGGARCHDIKDGVLVPGRDDELIKEYGRDPFRLFRIEGRSIWYDLELPNEEEYNEARENLKKHDYKVDYIITHCAPSCFVCLIPKKTSIIE